MNRIIDGLHDATDHVIDQQSKRIAELERKVQRMKAEAQLCRQDVGRDRERALDRIVEIAMAE